MTEYKRPQKTLDRFEPGGDLGPIEDRDKRAQLIASLPPAERALAQEVATFADLCQYFAQQQMDLPREVIAQMFQVPTLAIPERTVAMRHLNQVLMEHLDDAGQGSGFRQ